MNAEDKEIYSRLTNAILQFNQTLQDHKASVDELNAHIGSLLAREQRARARKRKRASG